MEHKTGLSAVLFPDPNSESFAVQFLKVGPKTIAKLIYEAVKSTKGLSGAIQESVEIISGKESFFETTSPAAMKSMIDGFSNTCEMYLLRMNKIINIFMVQRKTIHPFDYVRNTFRRYEICRMLKTVYPEDELTKALVGLSEDGFQL